MLDPYQTLGISRRASQAEIKHSYRRLAKELHPDRQPNNAQAADKFKEIASAYHVLGDARQRSKFDRGEIDANGNRMAGFQAAQSHAKSQSRPQARPQAKPEARPQTKSGPKAKSTVPPKKPFSFQQHDKQTNTGANAGASSGPAAPQVDATVEEPSFSNFGFGGFSASDIFQPFFRKDKKPAASGQIADKLDRRYKLEIGLLDAIKGGKKRLSLNPGQDVFVTVPPGVEDGQIIRLKGMGDKGSDKTSGDALVEIVVKHHPWFVRVGSDIHVELPVTVQEAVLGTRIEVPTIDGPVSVIVPKGSNAGVRLRLRGKGIVDTKTGKRGDQHLVIRIVLPENDSGFEKLVKQWAPDHDYDVRGVFRKLQE